MNDNGKFTAKLEYNITLADYIEANNVYIKTSKLKYHGYFVLGILAIVVGLLGIIIIPKYFASYLAILLGIYFFLSPTYLYQKRVKKIWERESSISEPLIVTLTDDEIIVKSPNEDGITKWKAFTHFVETKNLFLIFRQQNAFNVIPKRAFENHDLENNFRKLLQREFTTKQIQPSSIGKT